MKKIRFSSSNGKVFRNGLYSTAILAAAVILAVLLNLLVCGAAALPVGKRQQLLGDDAAQHGGQLAADLVLRTGRADVDDAVNRLRRADGV